jgi:SAM-dependent methyltransferase
MQAIKNFLKSVLPHPLIDRIRRFRSERHYRRYRSLTPEEIFSYIYHNRLWGEGETGGFRSGTGSLPGHSRAYEDFVVDLANRTQIRSILDIGCGDFQVSRRILGRLDPSVRYIGVDLVPKLIRHNQTSYGNARVSFAVLKAGEPYAEAELVTIRQVLQHNDNHRVAEILKQARLAGRWLVIAEHVPIAPKTPNLDIRIGHETRIDHGSGLYVDLPPFNLPVEEVVTFPIDEKTVLRITVSKFGSP